jgi:hypothetical protein
MTQQKGKQHKFCRIRISCHCGPRRPVLVIVPLAPARADIFIDASTARESTCRHAGGP